MSHSTQNQLHLRMRDQFAIAVMLSELRMIR